ncbi:MAG: hypothetical protein ACPG05_03850, partial [Bdellovibrionales bacterium]
VRSVADMVDSSGEREESSEELSPEFVRRVEMIDSLGTRVETPEALSPKFVKRVDPEVLENLISKGLFIDGQGAVNNMYDVSLERLVFGAGATPVKKL